LPWKIPEYCRIKDCQRLKLADFISGT